MSNTLKSNETSLNQRKWLEIMSLREIREERQRMLELVLVIILIGFFINVFATSLYSLFPNTIFWVVFSLLAVLVVAAYFVFASRLLAADLKKTIPFVFAVNVKEAYIPVFGLHGSSLSWASFFFREIAKETPGLKEKIGKASPRFLAQPSEPEVPESVKIEVKRLDRVRKQRQIEAQLRSIINRR
jgi:hypothetical protein